MNIGSIPRLRWSCLLLFEATLCIQRLRNLEQLRSIRRPARLLYAYRQKVAAYDVRRPRTWRYYQLYLQSKRKDPIPRALRLFVARRLGCGLRAMLTGESVPQRKEGLVDADLTTMLDVDGAHRKHVLFGGTDLLDVAKR